MSNTAKTYRYVGPEEVRLRVAGEGPGTEIRRAEDLSVFIDREKSQGTKKKTRAALKKEKKEETLTFVIDQQGALRVADRHSEHVACAGGSRVLSAGEMVVSKTTTGTHANEDVTDIRIVEISNQSTGYCPEPESWSSVARVLDAIGIGHPGRFTYEAIFRRCTACGERNLVKESWFVCPLCNTDLPKEWNFNP